MTNYAENLNEEQQRAVNTTDGPLLVIAGAGSGKTRVITHRIIHLLALGVDPSQILALTFTNKAAAEMRERVFTKTNAHILITTFHSLGARLLRETIHNLGYSNNFTIYDQDDSDTLLQRCYKKLYPENSSEDAKSALQSARKYISKIKGSALAPTQTLVKARNSESLENDKPFSDADEEDFHLQLFESYQKNLKENNAVDFDDLLHLPLKILIDFPFILQKYQDLWKYLLIDEYQDSNGAQNQLAKLLVGKSHNLCVVGDPDQAIYSWRGASMRNIMEFKLDYPDAEIISLEQNYRSRSHILDAANGVISHNRIRYEKDLRGSRGPGDKICLYTASTERNEAEHVIRKIKELHSENHIPWNQIVIFYRTHAQSMPYEDRLLANHIPYQVVGGTSFYQRKEIKDILALLRMASSNSDSLSFQRSILFAAKGIGQVTIDKLIHASAQDGIPLFEFCERLTEMNSPKPMRITQKQHQSLKHFVKIIQDLRADKTSIPISQLIAKAITISEYLNFLQKEKDSFEERQANLNALISKASDMESSSASPALEQFLEELSLRSTLDETDKDKSGVLMMTIHNSKGLEFDSVFIVGLEEGLFPHANSLENADSLEEERRLFYVGMTRARERLFISLAQQRTWWGAVRFPKPSSFLIEIPEDHVQIVENAKSQPRAKSIALTDIEISSSKSHESPNYIEDEPFSDEYEHQEELNVGDAVIHNTYGYGTITRVYTSGGTLNYKVFFSKDNREKTVMPQYAKLKKAADEYFD